VLLQHGAMTTASGAIVALVCLLAPSGGSVGEEPRGAEVDDAGFVGPVRLVAIDDAGSSSRWNVAPRLVEPGSPAWFQVRSWSVERGRLAILAQSHTFGSTPGLPSLRVDQVESAMGIAWQPRSSWLSVFVALRATSSAVRGADGAEVKAAVGLMAGLRIVLPSLVDVVRKWRAR
jgi:hypothetical protein